MSLPQNFVRFLPNMIFDGEKLVKVGLFICALLVLKLIQNVVATKSSATLPNMGFD